MADTPDTGSFGLGDILGLVGGLLGTWGNMQASSQYSSALRNVQNKESALFDQMAKTTPADQMQGIMALYQPLSATLRNQIIQAVTAQMSARGIAGNSGIMQEALDEALAKAILPTMQMAVQAYYQGRGQNISALPRTIGAPPQPGGNPFASLTNLLTNRTLWKNLLGGGRTDPGSSSVVEEPFNVPSNQETFASDIPISNDLSSAIPGLVQ